MITGGRENKEIKIEKVTAGIIFSSWKQVQKYVLFLILPILGISEFLKNILKIQKKV